MCFTDYSQEPWSIRNALLVLTDWKEEEIWCFFFVSEWCVHVTVLPGKFDRDRLQREQARHRLTENEPVNEEPED